jgi:uncharacterized protein
VKIDYVEMVKYYGKEILESENMQKEKTYMQHGKITVFDHSVAVAVESLKLAHRLGLPVDQKTLIRGALLHDYFLYDWHENDKSHRLHGFRHAKTALINAEKEYELNDIEKNMIYCHMFPLNLRIPKYRESILLTIADKIVATKETLEPYIKVLKVDEKYI